MYVYIYIYIYIYTYVCIHIYIYIYICVCVCVYKYKHCHMKEYLFCYGLLESLARPGAVVYPCPWHLLHVKGHSIDLPEASQATHGLGFRRLVWGSHKT